MGPVASGETKRPPPEDFKDLPPTKKRLYQGQGKIFESTYLQTTDNVFSVYGSPYSNYPSVTGSQRYPTAEESPYPFIGDGNDAAFEVSYLELGLFEDLESLYRALDLATFATLDNDFLCESHTVYITVFLNIC